MDNEINSNWNTASIFFYLLFFLNEIEFNDVCTQAENLLIVQYMHSYTNKNYFVNNYHQTHTGYKV